MYKGKVQLKKFENSINPEYSFWYLLMFPVDSGVENINSVTKKITENFIFEATMKFDSFDRMYGVKAVFTTIDGNFMASMFLSDFQQLILDGANLSSITGYWTFNKRGAYLGLKYLGTTRPRTDLELFPLPT